MYHSNDSMMATSSSPEDQPLLTLRFPKKLWRIVNECNSGAIKWSGDGSAVVIDYSKFQSDYLDKRLDIFKTSNITSFIRQLNLYGFRKVSPQPKQTPSYDVSMSIQRNANVHIFRNDSFVRGRPDLLQGVTRKTGALRARMMPRKNGACDQSSASSSGTNRAILERARLMQSQGRHLTARYRQLLLQRTIEKQRSASSRSPTSSASGSAEAGPSSLPPVVYKGVYEGDMYWYSQDSSTDSSSSDEDDEDDEDGEGIQDVEEVKEVEGADVKAEDAAGAADTTGEQSVPEDSSVNSSLSGWSLDYGTSAAAFGGASQQPTRGFDASTSPSSSSCGDIVALLDPNRSPTVVLMHHGRDYYEDYLAPPLEDAFVLEPLVSHTNGMLVDNKLYCCFMAEDEDNASGGSLSPVPEGTEGDALISASDQTAEYERLN